MFDEGTSCDGDRCGVEQIGDLMKNSAYSSGAKKVLHEMRSRWLEVREQRHARARSIDVVQSERDSQSPGDGE